MQSSSDDKVVKRGIENNESNKRKRVQFTEPSHSEGVNNKKLDEKVDTGKDQIENENDKLNYSLYMYDQDRVKNDYYEDYSASDDDNDDNDDDNDDDDDKNKDKESKRKQKSEAFQKMMDAGNSDNDDPQYSQSHLDENDLGNNDEEKVIGIEKFDCKTDPDEGYYDESGNFVFKKHKLRDADDVPDDFIEKLGDMKKDTLYLGPIHEEHEQFENKNMYLLRILVYLHEKEIVLEGLKRTEKKKTTKTIKPKKTKFAFMEEQTKEQSTDNNEDPTAFQCISECADKLVIDFPNIYNMTYEQLKKSIKIDQIVLKKKWQYYWLNQPETIYGPFTTKQMIDWMLQGCFKFNPLIREYQPETSETTKQQITTNTNNMLDDFDEFISDTKETEKIETKKWIPANKIDFYA